MAHCIIYIRLSICYHHPLKWSTGAPITTQVKIYLYQWTLADGIHLSINPIDTILVGRCRYCYMEIHWKLSVKNFSTPLENKIPNKVQIIDKYSQNFGNFWNQDIPSYVDYIYIAYIDNCLQKWFLFTMNSNYQNLLKLVWKIWLKFKKILAIGVYPYMGPSQNLEWYEPHFVHVNHRPV